MLGDANISGTTTARVAVRMRQHRRFLPGAVGVCLEELMGEEGGAEAKRYPLVAVRLQVTDHLQRVPTVHLRQLGTQPAQHRCVVSTGSRGLLITVAVTIKKP